MERSVIELYLGPEGTSLNKIERYPTKNFDNEDIDALLSSDIGRQCLQEIDRSTYLGNGAIQNEVLGVQPATKISGGLKTILMAMHYRDFKFPINNCGDNCAHAIYLSGINTPTKWYWLGYTPILLPEQIIQFPDLRLQTVGSELKDFMRTGIPYDLTVTGRAKRRKEEGLCAY